MGNEQKMEEGEELHEKTQKEIDEEIKRKKERQARKFISIADRFFTTVFFQHWVIRCVGCAQYQPFAPPPIHGSKEQHFMHC